MESTGIYWEPLAWALIAAGFPINLVNARHVKALRGHKTDSKDAAWLAKVSFLSTTNSSFIPNEAFRGLRILSRHRHSLVGELQSWKLRRTKLLDRSNVKLSSVFSDLSGKNATIVIHGLIKGWDPETIVSHLNLRKLKASREQILDALAGRLIEESRFTLTSIQNMIELLEREIATYTKKMIDGIRSLCPGHFKRLCAVPGLSTVTVAIFLIEIGGNVDAFPTCGNFVSWLGLCPGNNESAGKRHSGRTRKGNKFARRALIEAAQAGIRTKTSLGSKGRVLSGRIGFKKGIIAMAHKISRICYSMIKNEAEYRDPDIDYEQMRICQKANRNLKKISEAAGVSLSMYSVDTGEVVQTITPKVPLNKRPPSEQKLIIQLLPGVVS